jgi:uncharacterized RDD family membrane protein YckC
VEAAAFEPAVTQDDTRVSGRRFFAHTVDGLIYAVLFVALLLGCAALPDGTIGSVVFAIVLIGGLTVFHVAYFVLLQRRSGQTPGKHMAGIRVIDRTGATPTGGALIKRTIPLLIEYFYVLAFIAMMSSPYRQRLGDRWAETYVVKA